jgi:hypothetical protein
LNSRFEFNNYKLIRRDRAENSGGGFLQSNLNCSDIYMDVKSSNEIIGFKINFTDFQIGVIGAYRAPDRSEESFFNEIEIVSNSLNKKCSETIIIGDLNNNVLDPMISCCLKTFNENNGYKNSVRDGTRLNPTTGIYTLLDVILITSFLVFIASKVFSFPASDHCLVISIFNFKSSKVKRIQINSRCLNDHNLELMRWYFKRVKNHLLTDSTALWNEVKFGIFYCRDSCVKLKKFYVKPVNKTPWFDKKLLKLKKKEK